MDRPESRLSDARRGARAFFVKCAALVSLFLISCALAGGAGEGVAVKAADSESAVAEPSHEMALSGADCHSQGITVTGGRLFVSCVERKARKALVYSYEWPAGFAEAGGLSDPRMAEVTRGHMYHPSGLDHDGECVWAASAHYRSFMARSCVICLDPKTLEEKSWFMVDDHIGALAVMGSELVLMNWDARTLYRYSKKGDQLGRRRSPTGVAYQDCRGMSDKTILCSGKAKGGEAATVDLLAFDPGSGWSLSRRTRISHPGVSLGREGFTVIPGHWAFLPEDLPDARLMIYSPPVSWP